jgi:hypothetical protein
MQCLVSQPRPGSRKGSTTRGSKEVMESWNWGAVTASSLTLPSLEVRVSQATQRVHFGHSNRPTSPSLRQGVPSSPSPSVVSISDMDVRALKTLYWPSWVRRRRRFGLSRLATLTSGCSACCRVQRIPNRPPTVIGGHTRQR